MRKLESSKYPKATYLPVRKLTVSEGSEQGGFNEKFQRYRDAEKMGKKKY